MAEKFTRNITKIAIPEDLKKSLCWLYAGIQNNEEWAFGTDDTIQDDTLCGGLLEEGSDVYLFDYYPNKCSYDEKDKWWSSIYLTKNELEKISKGEQTHLHLKSV